MHEDLLQPLAEAVQFNCHLADARHAADLPLCTYLLQMREFHRWEQGLPFGAPLARDAVGRWLSEREALWARIEGDDYRALPGPGGVQLPPLEAAAVNRWLAPHGLHYGAGLVGQGRPVFVLAERLDVRQHGPLRVHVTGAERARGLPAPPAALGGAGDERSMLLRQDALARWCWQRYEAWTLRRSADSAFAAVVAAWRLDEDFNAGLARWLPAQAAVLVLHEQGEWQAGQVLDPAWQAMRDALPDRRADQLASAVRDLLADCSVTLPALLDQRADASLHGWFDAFEGVRAALYPALNSAYDAWRAGDGGVVLLSACRTGARHFGELAQALLALPAAERPLRLRQALAQPPA